MGIRIVGKGDALIRSKVGEVLATNGCKLTSHQQVEAAARSLKKGFEAPGDIAAIARKLKLAAIVTGEVNAPAGKARIIVHNGSNGATTADATFVVKGGADKLADAVLKTLWSRIGSGIENARPSSGKSEEVVSRAAGKDKREAAPPAADEKEEADKEPEKVEEEPPPKKAEEKKVSKRNGDSDASDKQERASTAVRKKAKKAKRSSDDDDDEEGGGGTGGFPALALEIGPRFLSRNLSYSKDFGSAILPFVVNYRTAMGFSAVWFPAAHMTSAFISNVGLVVDGEYASTFISKSPPPDSLGYPTKGSDYFGGVRVRTIVGSFLEPSVTAGLGHHAFVFASGPAAPRNGINVPDMDYSYLRFAGNVRLQLPVGLSVMAGAGYRLVTSPGNQPYQIQSAQYFPRATVTGFDAVVAAGYRVHPLVEVRAGFDLRRYIYKTNALASDPIPLSGFADHYQAIWVHLAIVVDGMGGGHARGKAPPAGTVSGEDDEE
ncbi:MAG TPA: hypothetical protein VFH73_06555 [Polyangia bacterium]|nr:hypothetical protein [Polyangia bacterium]